MCRFSFINVVCEISKLNCDLYKYMFYLSHGKAKEKKKKGRGLPRVPGHLALGEEEIKKKWPRAFPECPGTWHSGKTKIKKTQSLPRVPWQLALGEEFKKKRISSPSVALGEEVKKRNFFPECYTRGRVKKPVNGVKSSPSATVALGEVFPECTIFGTREELFP
jgi:hypothetical protein